MDACLLLCCKQYGVNGKPHFNVGVEDVSYFLLITTVRNFHSSPLGAGLWIMLPLQFVLGFFINCLL